MVNCLECNKVCVSEEVLHRHLRAHKMSQGNYYVKHFPRYDKLDGTPIIFRNREIYFISDFNTRSNLKDWLNQTPAEEAKEYVRALLLDRKAKKSLVYAPCQVELRSLPMPGMVYMNRLFGSYYNECVKLGFKLKCSCPGFNGVWKEFKPEHIVLSDTREQMPLSFTRISSVIDTLDFGDYKLNDDAFTHNLVIERKSVADFYSTMSGAYERFCREIKRAEDDKFYLVVMIEGTFEEIYKFSLELKKRQIIISPEYVFHNMRKLCQDFPWLQFLFVENRDEASEVIIKLFQSDGQYRNIDLQYAYDTGNLI